MEKLKQFRQGDVLFEQVKAVNKEGLTENAKKHVALGEIVEIPNLYGYGVDVNGNFYSRWKQISKIGQRGFKSRLISKWKRLNCTKTKKGYMQVRINSKCWRVHRLIAETFLRNHEKFPFVLHKNDIKTDNRISNLYWGTHLNNMNDKRINGNVAHGEDMPQAKLSYLKILEILQLRKNGSTLMAIARKFNVSKKLILLVVQRKIWKHVDDKLSIAKQPIVALGEVSHHEHRFGKGATVLERPDSKNWGRAVIIGEPTEITHQEHDPIQFEPAEYTVIHQRRYSDAGLRRVQD